MVNPEGVSGGKVENPEGVRGRGTVVTPEGVSGGGSNGESRGSHCGTPLFIKTKLPQST